MKPMLSLMLKLLKIENEENVLVCLKIIIELHKHYRPAYSSEIHEFLVFVKTIYSELPEHIDKIFEPRDPIRINHSVNHLSKAQMEELLKETFTMTTIQARNEEGDEGTFADVSCL